MHKRFFLLTGLILLALFITSCGSSAQSPATPKATPGNAFITSITQVAQADSAIFHAPLDSTPDASGTVIYFTATGPHGAGVFRVPAAGGTATEVFAGAPFVTPRGLAVSPDGALLTIADAGAGKGGDIFTLSTVGGSPSPIQGSQGTAPQNLNVYTENGQQQIYFTGKDPQSGQPAILTLPVKGAKTPDVIFKGAPLVAPDGIVLAPSGTIYIADRAAAGADSGKIFKLENGAITALLNQVHTGNPAGIALSPDASTLLISAHQSKSVNDQVLLLDLSTLQTSSFTKVVGQNISAGGLHASPNHKEIFSWADSSAGPNGGRVFSIK